MLKTTIFHHTKNSLSDDVKNQSRTIGSKIPFLSDREQIRTMRPVVKH